MLLQQSIEHVSIVYTRNTYFVMHLFHSILVPYMMNLYIEWEVNSPNMCCLHVQWITFTLISKVQYTSIFVSSYFVDTLE